jgi:hypothetical protein
VDEGKALWGAIGELRRTRRELVTQLARAAQGGSSILPCSFCGEGAPNVTVIPGPDDVAICDRCVGLCSEILELARHPG